MSFGLEGRHVFVAGAAGAIGREVVREFLRHGCKVTAHSLRPDPDAPQDPDLFSVTGDSSESSIASCFNSAVSHFRPVNILICCSDVSELSPYNIWDLPLEAWENAYQANIRANFLAIKHFLRSVSDAQLALGRELENVSIVVTGQTRDSDNTSVTDDLQSSLVGRVRNDIVELNRNARINSVTPGQFETGSDGPKKFAVQPQLAARVIAYLSSHQVAGHITGACLSLEAGLRLMGEVSTIAPPIRHPRRARVLLSVDFDAVSGFLGTGASPTNGLADFSSGYFAAQVGVPRLLRLFQKHGISSSVTWFVPGHSMESFPKETRAIVDSGAEIGCHGYAHEGAVQMTEAQEREVIEKCVQLATNLTGKKPLGWRAPLYQLRDHTVKVLEEHGFLYDTSLTHHDSSPYFLLTTCTPKPIDFSPSVPASSWMHPVPPPAQRTSKTLVEIPCNWYMEDMTPMQFLPAAPNSHGFVSPEIIERNWMARFEYLYNETIDGVRQDFVFPLILHPDTSGMAHVIGMIDRMVGWLKQWDDVEFVTFEKCAAEWKAKQ